jgi:hypothetical protein
MLTGAEHLDGWDLSHAVDAADLEAKVSAQGGGRLMRMLCGVYGWMGGWGGGGSQTRLANATSAATSSMLLCCVDAAPGREVE